MLLAAGLAGGIASALAGGASLVTFPAMLAAGLPPVVASASNAIAIAPSSLFAVLADRHRLPAASRGLAAALVAVATGGIAGAVLLLFTSERVFTLLVPLFIGLATLLFALGKQVRTSHPRLAAGPARAPLLALVSVYGGYFGAGLGVIYLAVLAVTGKEPAREANVLKNLLSIAVSAASIPLFVTADLVRWPETLAMLAGASAGGWTGGRLAAVLPPATVRRIIVGVGVAMTAVYAWRYWL
jgi:hypothetical protein